MIVMKVTMIMIFSEPVSRRNPWLTLNHSMDLKVTNQLGAVDDDDDDDDDGDDDDDDDDDGGGGGDSSNNGGVDS